MAPPVCGGCGSIPSGSYDQAGDRLLCAACGEKAKASGVKPPGLLGLFKRAVEVRGPFPMQHPMPPPGAGV